MKIARGLLRRAIEISWQMRGLWIGLVISLSLLAYALSSLPGHLVAAFLASFPFLIALHLRWIKALELERAERIKALELERAERVKALELEKAKREAMFARRKPKFYQHVSRELTLDDERLLCSFWSDALGISVQENYLRYLQQRINQVESLCLGRLAGDIQDAILRVLVASSTKGNSLRILEIGTLFGVNAVLLYDITSCLFEQVKLLIIDPLNGYYEPGQPDPPTGLPVTRGILKRNLDLLMIPPEDYEIVQEHSTAPAAIEQARLGTYNFMFIDGDHSYEGVKADFQLYSPMLERAGYLVFDNYLDGTSPGVDRFIQEDMQQSPLYECVGFSWRTIVFRKK